MKQEFLQETTKDWKADYRVPNHTYIMEGSKCVGYIPEGTELVEMFNESFILNKKGRTFKKV